MGLNEIASYFPLTTFELGRRNLLQLQYGKKKHGVLIIIIVYGTYAELLQFNDCYKGIVLFCHVINKY